MTSSIIVLDGLPSEVKQLAKSFEALRLTVKVNVTPWQSTFETLTNDFTEGILLASRSVDPVVLVFGYLAHERAQGKATSKTVARVLERITKRFGIYVHDLTPGLSQGYGTWELIAKGVAANWLVPEWAKELRYEAFTGDPLADVVLVGDRHNHKAENVIPWPFHLVKNSSLWLDRALELNGLPGDVKLGFLNINDQDGPEVLWHLTTGPREPRFVALGREAERALGRLGVSPAATCAHPSYARRFLAGRLEDYGKSLAAAIETALQGGNCA